MTNQDPNPYATLTEALRERLSVIADREAFASNPEAHLERLKAVSERITSSAECLPRPVPPDLAHYLQRASFDKALAWLETNQP